MACTLSWTDVPEPSDDSAVVESFSFSPGIPLPQELDSHVLIEGDNYPALRLLSKAYDNSVDCIYIDPPYNTGGHFVYEDSFSQDEYLSFMHRRLALARRLLCDSGCIFIAIGQEELYALKLLCDGVFGADNFVNDFMWLHGKGKKDRWSRTLQQHTLCYAKDKKHLAPFCEVEVTDWATKNADDDPRGNWFSGSISFSEQRSNKNHRNYFEVVSPGGTVWRRQWLVSREKMAELLAENKIFFGKDLKSVPRVKIFNGEKTEVIPKNIFDCAQGTRSAQRQLDLRLGAKGVFDNPKPVPLVARLLSIVQLKKDALVLDFFAGSGTTLEAVLAVNAADGGKRKCILIQKLEPTYVVRDGKKIPRKGSEAAFFAGFYSVADICRARVRAVLAAHGCSKALIEVRFCPGDQSRP